MNYMLFGSELYNLRQRRQAIIREILQDDDFNLHVHNGDIVMEDVISDCQMLPFFSEAKVVIVENPPFLTSTKQADEDALELLMNYLKSPAEFTTLILYCDQSLDKRRSSFTALRKLLKTEEFDTLKQDDFLRIVKQDLRDHNLKLEGKAYNLLTERLPLDVDNWKNELGKLLLYPGRLDEEAIRNLIARPIEDDVFELSNAVVNRKLDKAIECYHDLIRNNRDMTASLIGLLAYQLRFMAQVRNMYEQGYKGAEIASHYKTVEFRIRKTLEASGRMTSKELMGILDELSVLDQDIKTGKVNGELGLELFIMKVAKR